MKTQVNASYSIIAKLLIALVVALALLVAPLGTNPAHATSLKAADVTFTQPGKTFKSKLWYAGAGKHTVTCSVKSVKVKKAKKAGYKIATVVLEVRDKWKPKNRQIKAMVKHLNSDDSLECGWWWAFVVDGKTGEYLDTKKVADKYGITLKTKGWYDYNIWRHTATDGSWVEIPKVSRIKYTITYPKSYKNLCCGVGVGQKKYNESAMSKFEDGKVTYQKSWWHKNNKSNTRFVKVK